MRFSNPLLAFLFAFGLICTCHAAPLNSTDQNEDSTGIQITFSSSLIGSFVDKEWCPGHHLEPRTPCNKDYAYNNMYFMPSNRLVPGATGINSGATITCPKNLSGDDCTFLVTGQYTINDQMYRMYFDESGMGTDGPITPNGRGSVKVDCCWKSSFTMEISDNVDPYASPAEYFNNVIIKASF